MGSFSFLQDLQAKREPTSGLEPLTCSLRVIIQALQRFAGACKTRIDKPISFLRLALCCTVLRSRWYQSGINRGKVLSQSCSRTHPQYVQHPTDTLAKTYVRPLLSVDVFGEPQHRCQRGRTIGPSARLYSCPWLLFGGSSGRSHKETWEGSIVFLTTPSSSLFRASKSVSSLSFAEKASKVFLASYFLR
jgi:hypothetical protein